MPLSYQDISRFVRNNGDVKAFAERGQVTLLKDGSIDSVSFIEQDVVRFEYRGASYSRAEFEQIVSSLPSQENHSDGRAGSKLFPAFSGEVPQSWMADGAFFRFFSSDSDSLLDDATPARNRRRHVECSAT